MIKKLSLLGLVLFIAVMACTSEGAETEPALDPLTGETYFFLREGKFREYQVYEIRYRAVDISDTLRYQLREEVRGTFTNNSGETSHLIHRLVRDDVSQEWELDSIWSARVADQSAISVENNVPFVKIQFPPLVERKWDANLLNSQPLDSFTVITFSPLQDDENTTNFMVPGLPGENSVTPVFTEVLVIQQEAFQDDQDGALEHPVTERDFRTEVYKDSIGLVFKEYNVVKLCTRPDCLGQGIIQSGRFYREVLINEGDFDD